VCKQRGGGEEWWKCVGSAPGGVGGGDLIDTVTPAEDLSPVRQNEVCLFHICHDLGTTYLMHIDLRMRSVRMLSLPFLAGPSWEMSWTTFIPSPSSIRCSFLFGSMSLPSRAQFDISRQENQASAPLPLSLLPFQSLFPIFQKDLLSFKSVLSGFQAS